MTDLFSGDDNHLDTNTAVDPLEALTGPGGKYDRSKYADETEMYKAIAKGKVEADGYIDHFKQRHDELRRDYEELRTQHNAGPKLQELLERIQNQQHTDSNNHSDSAQPEFDLAKIEELVASKLSAHEQAKLEDANARKVEAKLIEHFGPNYQSALKSQVDAMGLDKDFVNGLARKHPEVLFRTLGITGQRQSETFQAPPSSSQGSFTPNAPARTWSYYQKMRKENPTAYRSPKIQDQMFKDAAAMGEKFQDGDWGLYGH